MTRMVRLKNGTSEVGAAVVAVVRALRDLLNDDPVAFCEFVRICRDKSHPLDNRIYDELAYRLLVMGRTENGGAVVHATTRNVVLCAVEGDIRHLQLVSPYASS